MRGPSLAAVIEIGPDTSGEVPVELVQAAYRASGGGTVVLLLNGVSPAQVDQALDPVVSRVRGVQGVVYCTPESLDSLLQQRGQPRLASVRTTALAAPLAHDGVRVVSPERALRALGGHRSKRQNRSQGAVPSGS